MFYTLNDLSGVQYSDTDCLEIQLYVESQLALIEALMSLVKEKVGQVLWGSVSCPGLNSLPVLHQARNERKSVCGQISLSILYCSLCCLLTS